MVRDAVGKAGHGSPGFRGELVTGAGGEPRGIDDPAVPIELVLVGRAVADSDGSAVFVAPPSLKRAFGRCMFAVECEQNGKTWTVESARVQEPCEKHASFVLL